MNNPDGASLYHLTAQTLRSTVRATDNDGDGLLDEDAGEDLDGDGFIRQMRRAVGKGKGGWIKDPKDAKGRAMRRVRDGEGDYEVLLGGDRQRWRRPLQRRWHRRPRPAPQLPGELAADARGDRPRPDAGRRRRLSVVRARDPRRLSLPDDASEHRHRQLARYGRAHGAARTVDEHERRNDVSGRPRIDSHVRREGSRDYRVPVGRRHLRGVCDPGWRQSDHRRAGAADAALRPRA